MRTLCSIIATLTIVGSFVVTPVNSEDVTEELPSTQTVQAVHRISTRHAIEKANYEIEEEPIFLYDIPIDYDLQEYTYNLCVDYGVDYDTVIALMWSESNFETDIISSTNDYGIMQINKINHKWISEELGTTDFLDPYQNIEAGIYILAMMNDKYDDEHMVLMSYNCGEGGAAAQWRRGIYSSSYSRTIMERKEQIHLYYILS